jgi:mannitol/fructose-specific phosphotransferase system IIA component (Ntr-type)
VILDAEGDSLDAALEDVLRRTPPSLLPAPAGELSRAIKAHGRSGYVGRGLAIPHARLSGLKSPFVLFARLKQPLPVPAIREPQAVRYLLVLLTPALSHRLHQTYLMRVAKVFEREFFEKRLEMAKTREDFWELFRQVEDATDLTP